MIMKLQEFYLNIGNYHNEGKCYLNRNFDLDKNHKKYRDFPSKKPTF